MDRTSAARRPKSDSNRLAAGDRAAHDWYRFVLSYPPHLVRSYVEQFGLNGDDCVLDPFCGTGTTIVECKKLGVASVGVEANPMAHFASQVKADWSIDPDALLRHAEHVAGLALAALHAEGNADDPPQPGPEAAPPHLRTLPPASRRLLLTDSISPLPLHKTLTLLACMEQARDARVEGHERLALARALVTTIGNLHFGPEVGVGVIKPDAPVIAPWLAAVHTIADDLRTLQGRAAPPALVHRADARRLETIIAPGSVSAVITSPPYPNEKDYTRATRLESVLLGFLHTRDDLRALKKRLVRSNTRGVYKDDDDDQWVRADAAIQRIADQIEARRIALGKTSGFERLYSRVTKLYFGGMARHLAQIRPLLRPGAQLAYVVGDQASYLRVMIRTGQLLGEIARALGYELVRIDLFRTRLATATGEQLREEVVVLRWPTS